MVVSRLPYNWRITRYDPALRDARGAYTEVTWTSSSDVGRAFNGVVLSAEEYERVETLYLAAANRFAQESGVTALEVRGVDYASSLATDGDVVNLSLGLDLVKANLREELSCRLEAVDDRFYVHVGFDLYMYIGSETDCSHAVEAAQADGLFVEAGFESPQLPE